ncbi:hypothetical protein TNCV_795801 [Trichonephila clavipes]|nr:hypothetical protein TNCV_795801 [Trichonephila clavipes]
MPDRTAGRCALQTRVRWSSALRLNRLQTRVRWSSAPRLNRDSEDDTSPVCHTPVPEVGKIQSTLPMMWGQW